MISWHMNCFQFLFQPAQNTVTQSYAQDAIDESLMSVAILLTDLCSNVTIGANDSQFSPINLVGEIELDTLGTFLIMLSTSHSVCSLCLLLENSNGVMSFCKWWVFCLNLTVSGIQGMLMGLRSLDSKLQGNSKAYFATNHFLNSVVVLTMKSVEGCSCE